LSGVGTLAEDRVDVVAELRIVNEVFLVGKLILMHKRSDFFLC